MTAGKKYAIWSGVVLGILGAAVAAVLLHKRPPVILKGAVLQQDSDPNKQVPIAGADVVATNEVGTGTGKSDASGFFQIALPKGLRRRQQVVLRFRHAGYEPLDLNDYISDSIYVARMAAIPQPKPPDTRRAA